MDQNYYKEVSDSLKLVFDLTIRIDERMKSLIANNEEAKEKIDKLFENQTALLGKVIILENKNASQFVEELKKEIDVIEGRVDHLADRLVDIEKDMQMHAGKWTSFFDFIFKIAVMVVGGIILWKLGLKP